MLAPSMQPKWKIDTYYIPLSDGIYLRGNNNRLILKGKSLYSLLERLIPNLDGNASLEEITAGLDVNRKRMLTKLLEKLLAHDFLSDASQDQQHTLCPLELETYALNIAFIESFQVSAASRFEDFRNKRLLLIGSGPCFTALVQACLQSGVKKISAIITSENATEASSRQELLHVFANDTFEQTMDFIDAPSWNNEAEVGNTIQTYDAILHISKKPLLARSQLLNRLCLEQRKVFIQAILVADRVWLGPLVCPETGGCWECAWRRLQATLTDFSAQSLHYEFQDHFLSTDSESLAGPGATIVANQLIFTLFQYFTRTNSSEVVGKLSAFDPTTLLSENHTFLPHPHCLACQRSIVPTAVQFLEQIQWLQRQEPEDPDMLLDKVAGCIDEKLGLFAAPNNRNFVQVPLAVYKVPISHPARRHSSEGSDIVAVGVDTRDAQRQAVQKACMYYAASLVDQRR
ncbi:MAG TPA: TOMM precursor leader peptide-binding protein, partial [Ktedonobacteraceae bacterium]|nr:TOMM precursor leader peptide-binding protein [Ktedonobacteraceae bacterium]